MRHRVQSFAFVVLALALAGLTGCAASPPKEVKLAATLVASAEVNPDADGRSSPTVVRIYQLRSSAKFNNSDFFGIYDDAAAALGADLISFDEFTLRPGQSIQHEAVIDPSAKSIGVIAAFRDINSAQWRVDLALPEKPGQLQVALDKMSLSASFK